MKQHYGSLRVSPPPPIVTRPVIRRIEDSARWEFASWRAKTDRAVRASYRESPIGPVKIVEGVPYASLPMLAGSVSAYYNVSLIDLRSPHRISAPMCRARHVFGYLAWAMSGASTPMMGRFLHRDHSTFVYAIHKVRGMLASGDDRVALEIHGIRRIIGSVYDVEPFYYGA